MKRMIRCKEIRIDCLPNTKEIIDAGGPEYIGFSFNIPRKRTVDMKEFIIDNILGYEMPICGIRILGDTVVPQDQVYDEKRIANYIRTHAKEYQKLAKQRSNKTYSYTSSN